MARHVDTVDTESGSVAETVLELFDRLATGEDAKPILVDLLRITNGREPSVILREHFRENAVPKSDHGFYTLEDFQGYMIRLRGQTYGWRVDLTQATKITPGVKLCRNEDIQKWQKTGNVPAWAYEQLSKLVWPKRKGENGPNWSTDEYAFLKRKYLENPKTPNKELARLCTEKFGRPITENAIRGALNRLRQRDELPKFRPGRKATEMEAAA